MNSTARDLLNVLRHGISLPIVVALLASGGCAHAPETAQKDPMEATGAVYGCVTIDVLETLDYFLPKQRRRAGVVISLVRDGVSLKEASVVRMHTDRRGCFQRSDLPSGSYRIVRIRAPGKAGDRPGSLTVEMVFPLWEQSFGVGYGTMGTTPVAEGELPVARFELAPGQTLYLGHLELSFRKAPFDPEEACLTRELRFPGIGGELYLSSTPVGARLCVEQRSDEREGDVPGTK